MILAVKGSGFAQKGTITVLVNLRSKVFHHVLVGEEFGLQRDLRLDALASIDWFEAIVKEGS